MSIEPVGRVPKVESRPRAQALMTLILLATIAVTAFLAIPATMAKAAVSGHISATWNMDGSNDQKWSDVSKAAMAVEMICLQETGTPPQGATFTKRSWSIPAVRPGKNTPKYWTVSEYQWSAGGGTRYIYYLPMPAPDETRNSMAIVSMEPVENNAVVIINPQPWRNGTVDDSARPAFGIQLPSDKSFWWTWHAGSGASGGQANDAANMATTIAATMNAARVGSWTINADFNRDMLNKNSGFTNPPLPAGVRTVTPGNSITRPNPISGGTQLDFMITNDTGALRAQTTGVFSDHFMVVFGTPVTTPAAVRAGKAMSSVQEHAVR